MPALTVERQLAQKWMPHPLRVVHSRFASLGHLSFLPSLPPLPQRYHLLESTPLHPPWLLLLWVLFTWTIITTLPPSQTFATTVNGGSLSCRSNQWNQWRQRSPRVPPCRLLLSAAA